MSKQETDQEREIYRFIRDTPGFKQWLWVDYRDRKTGEMSSTLLVADGKGHPTGHLTLNREQVTAIIKQLQEFLVLCNGGMQ